MLRKIGLLVFIAPVLVAQVRVTPQSGPRASQQTDYIVSFQPATSLADRAASVRRAGATLRFNYRIVDAAAVRVPNANALAALRRDMSVVRIIPDRPVHAFQSTAAKPPNKGKPGNGGSQGQVLPEGVRRVVGGTPTNSDGSGIGVAVLDTGIDLANEDLPAVSGAFNAFDANGSCQDDNGHGTHVAGIIAAQDNTIDVVGVAPGVALYCGKVLDSTGSGADSDVIAGLDWIWKTYCSSTSSTPACPSVQVVNMSLGRPGTLNDDAPLRGAIQNLYNAGVAVVVAAGNDPNVEVSQMVPATYPEVFAVASTTAIDGQNRCKRFSGAILADTASYFTTDGAFNTTTKIGVTISAPGEKEEDVNPGCRIQPVGVLSLKLRGGTTRMYGTSMAAPHVAGVVARILQNGVATSPQGVRTWLRLNANRRGAVPLDSPTVSYTFDGEREGIAVVPSSGAGN